LLLIFLGSEFLIEFWYSINDFSEDPDLEVKEIYHDMISNLFRASLGLGRVFLKKEEI